MNLELSRRLAQAFMVGAAQFDERDALIHAAERVDAFSQLPAPMRDLLVEIETRPVNRR